MSLDKKRGISLIILFTFLVFAKAPFFDFVNLDDVSHLESNPNLGISLSHLKRTWEKPYLKLYIPLTYTLWGVLSSVSENTKPQSYSLTGVKKEFKYRAILFHLVNILFHLGSVFLVFQILLFVRGAESTGVYLGTLLFATHPVQVEPIVWVSGLKDTFSGFLFFSCFYLFLKRKIVPSFLCFFASLLAKPTTIVLPLILLFFSKKKDRLFLVSLLFLSLPFAYLTIRAQPDESFSFRIPELGERVLIGLDAIGFYISKISVPFSLGLDYGRTPEVALGSRFYCLLGVFVILVGFFYRKKFPLVSIVLFLIFLLPYLGLKPFVFQTTSTVSDRYLYLALFGLAYGLSALTGRQVGYLAVALGLFWGARSFDQVSRWKNTESILTHTLKVNPKSWIALNNLGVWYESENKYELALEKYKRASEISKQSIFYNNMGVIYLSLYRFQEAKEAFMKGLELNPTSEKDRLGLEMAIRGMN